MAGAQETLDRATLFLREANKGVLTIAQARKLIQALRTLISATRQALEKRMAAVEDTVASDMQTLQDNLEQMQAQLDRMEAAMPAPDELDNLRTAVDQRIDSVKQLIPSMPDLGPLGMRVAALEDEDDSADAIRNKLELLTGDERLNVTALSGLEDLVRRLAPAAAPGMQGSVVGRDIVQDVDISDQLNGSTKTFQLPATWRIISVDLSSYPYGSLRKNIDYTWTPTSITFTNQIDATTQLSAGQKCILTIVTA